MPGPGGGGRGGGGFGGGFGGGGGRGFGGGFYHRPHYYGGFYHRPFFYGGGGCLGGLLGIFFGPIIMIVMAAILLFSFLGTAVTDVAQGGSVVYNEEVFQDYVDDQYAQVFGGSTAYEDNLLLVFLTTEDNKGYAYIAWVGDHVHPKVNLLFGGSGTSLGTAIDNSVNTANYKYSLDTNLAMVVGEMEEKVEALGLEDNFNCQENHVQVESHLINETDLSITTETVDSALESFTESTGISFVILVEEAEEVFGKTIHKGNIVFLFVAAGLLILAIVMLAKGFKRKKRNPDDDFYEKDQGYDRY